MGRPKEFDRDEVLMRAVDTFWARGFEGTSVQMLVENMGIHRASLYDTYGSKAELFKEAMDRYSEQTREAWRQALTRPGDASEVLASFLFDLVTSLCTTQTQGCLMVKTVLTVADEVPGAHERIVRHMEEVRGLVRGLLQRDPQLAPRADEHADYLLTVLHGIIVGAAVYRDDERLKRTIELALRPLAG